MSYVLKQTWPLLDHQTGEMQSPANGKSENVVVTFKITDIVITDKVTFVGVTYIVLR